MKLVAQALAALTLTFVLSLGFVGAAGAATASGGGTAVVVVGDGSSSPRNRGGSATPFSLALPKGATCPGDSADGGFRVQSFLVPGGTDPAALRYQSTGPQGDGLYPLFDLYTHGFVQVQTANADRLGGPGPIVNIPTFDYKVFPPGTLAPGRYHVGIACTLNSSTVRFWSVDIVLTASAGDRPAGFRWTLANAAPGGSGGSSQQTIGAVVVVLVVAVVATVLFRRRRSSARSLGD